MKLNRLIKMTLALVMSVAIVMPQMTILSKAEIPDKELLTTKIPLTEISHLRELSDAQQKTSLVVDGRSSQSNSRLWITKFDFADIAESLESFDDLVSVKFVSTLAQTNHDTAGNISKEKEVDIYLLPQNMENWSENQSWSTAKDAGIIDYMYDYSNAIFSEPLGEVGTKTTDDIKSYIINHLKTNSSDTVVSIGCSARRAASKDKTGDDPNAWAALGVYNGKGTSEPYLEVKYYGKNLVKDIADNFTFDDIKGENEAEDSIVSALNLPRKVGDALVWWSSDMPEIINPYNGAVKRPSYGEEPIDVTLTAEFSIDPFKGSKDYELTVLPLGVNDKEPVVITKKVELIDVGHIREKNDSVQSKTYLIIDGRTSQTNSRMWFTKYDLSDALDGFEPDDIKSVRFMYTLGDANISDTYDSTDKPVDFYVLPQELEGWDGETLIYADAEEMGLVDYSYNKYNASYTQLQMGHAGDYRSLNIAPSIIDHLKKNTGDMIVAMACSSRRPESSVAGTPESVAALGTYVGINTDSPAPHFVIELYDRAQTLVDDVRDNLTFDKISSENINSVTKNLTLPKQIDGAEISWSSSLKTSISDEGHVVRGLYGTADKEVKLTANISYKNKTATREFDITVLSDRKNTVIDAVSAPLTQSEYADNALYTTFDLTGGLLGDVCLLKLTPTSDAKDVAIKVYVEDSTTPIYEKTVDTKANEPLYTTSLHSALSEVEGSVKLKVVVQSDDEITFYAGDQSADVVPSLVMLPKETVATEALKELTFDDIKGANEKESLIRYTLNLSKDGKYGSEVLWSSSNTEVISESGIVTRQDKDEVVTLTAKVTVAGYSVSKTFNLNVMRIDTTVGFLDSVLAELVFDSNIITNDFDLPTTAYDGVTLSWVSESSNILAINDNKSVTVTRPAEKDRTVKLIANAKKGELLSSCEFEFTVIRNDKNNLLYGKTVLEADSNQANAIDDKISTVWDVASSNTLYVDRGTAKSVTAFGLVYNGGDISGFDISTSYDGVKWTNQTVNKTLKSGVLNYVELQSPAYVKYIKVIFPSAVSQVAYFAAYDDEIGDQSINNLDDITIPESVSSNFNLPTVTSGGADIEWTSANTKVIAIRDGRAIVTQQATTQRVLLEAKATIDGQELAKSFYVSVMKKPSSGSGGGGGGSSTIIPFVGAVQNSVQMPSPDATTDTVFTDISDVKWAEPYITALYKKGIISGKGESKYEPFSPLKREELAKLLTLGFNLDGNDETFTDVNVNDWFYPYVCAMYSSGISNGMDDTTFGTGANITRQDATVMIARILEKEGLLKKATNLTSFADDSDISDYAKDAVYSLRAMEIINGDDSGRFNPKSNITRAEIAKVIYLAIMQCE
ncbi:MAG: hypothetical protein E7395_00220 [Ruminococcaceae bacterium]|nr:hypothetical protein [Oscillospiraceae bacterium]